MQEKQKVTLYIPPDLHRQLKIRSAVADEPMSTLAERALNFYLTYPETVEQCEVHGRIHQVHQCPECQTSIVWREGDLVALGNQPALLPEALVMQQVCDSIAVAGEEVLTSCSV
jgi:hypothetical protein